MNNCWQTSLPFLLDHAWVRLQAAVQNHDTVNFASVDSNGWPEARTVVLRGADPENGCVAIYTDSMSDKMQSLRLSPRAAITLWDPDQRLQLRLQGNVSIQSGEAIAHLWSALPPHSLLNYGVTPAPGQVIAGPDRYLKASDPTAFAVLTCVLTYIDVVQLDDPHRRAAFSRDSDWAGNWLAP